MNLKTSLQESILNKKRTISANTFCTNLCVVFLLLIAPTCSVIATGQVVLPQYTGCTAPVPSPLLPGDTFQPVMCGIAGTKAPAFAEWTRTAGPDELMVTTGIRFSEYSGSEEGKDSRFIIYDGTRGMKEAKVQRLDRNKAILTLPHNSPQWGMYLIWPGNESGYGKPIAVNRTDAWWVGPDKANRGDTVSVYGRNLTHGNDTLVSYVFIKPSTGVGQWASVTKVNPYRVAFKIPINLANGDYEIWTHNGHGGKYGWSGPLMLNVNNWRQWSTTVFNVRNYGAAGDGKADDTQAIRKALLAAKLVANSTVYFPAGVYMVSNSLEPTSNTRWKGNDRNTTVVKCAGAFSAQAAALLYCSVENFEIKSMTFYGNGNYKGIHPEPIFLRGSKNILLNNVLFSFQGYNVLQLDNSYNSFITNCEIIGKTSFLGHASQLFIDRCTFKLTNDAEMALDSWGGSGISLTNSTCRDFNNTDSNSGAGWGKGRFYTGRGNFGSSSLTYIANNTTFDLGVRPIGADQNSGEQYMWEGYTTDWAGPVTASTDVNTTLKNFSFSYGNSHHAIITAGMGCGQSRKIVSYNGNTVTLEKPWELSPDKTSLIAIANVNDRTVLYKNRIDGKISAVTNITPNASAGIEPYGATLNFIADHNIISDVRVGIANWATQNSVELDPNYFSLYTKNVITNCRWAIQNGLQMSNPKECGMLGIMYRKNSAINILQSAVVNTLTTSALSVFSSFVYEHNVLTSAVKGFSTGGDLGLPNGFPSSGAGIESQTFYKNVFNVNNSTNGVGIKATLKMCLRENVYNGFTSAYAGTITQSVLEAPFHVTKINGSVGTNSVRSNFIIWNAGTNVINWSAVSNSSWLTFSTTSGTIPSEENSSVIVLSANPTGLTVGTYKATITVTTNGQIKKYTVVFRITPASAGHKTVSPLNTTIAASSAGSLPDMLLNFTVWSEGPCAVHLIWFTSSEAIKSALTVEHSLNACTFKTIDIMAETDMTEVF